MIAIPWPVAVGGVAAGATTTPFAVSVPTLKRFPELSAEAPLLTMLDDPLAVVIVLVAPRPVVVTWPLRCWGGQR
jgi:hypothetical protein